MCQRCGTPVDLPDALTPGGLCPACAAAPPHYQALRSFGPYEGSLRTAIQHLKYKGDMGLGEVLSKHLIELYNEIQWEIDLVVPVPLGQHRRKKRGFNQAAMLGRPLAYAIQKPLRQGALWRKRETRSQVGLSAHERRTNVSGAFSAREDQVRGKAVLLIDDVTTTGSTISACAQALCEAGARIVYGMTLARALLKTHTDDLPNPTHINRR
jgi:ComF family protein